MLVCQSIPVIIMAGIDRQGVVSLNGTVNQHVPMYMNMYLSVKIRGGLNTVLVNMRLLKLAYCHLAENHLAKRHLAYITFCSLIFLRVYH